MYKEDKRTFQFLTKNLKVSANLLFTNLPQMFSFFFREKKLSRISLCRFFRGSNFREFAQNSRKSRKVLPAKVSSFKVVHGEANIDLYDENFRSFLRFSGQSFLKFPRFFQNNFYFQYLTLTGHFLPCWPLQCTFIRSLNSNCSYGRPFLECTPSGFSLKFQYIKNLLLFTWSDRQKDGEVRKADKICVMRI